MAVRLLERPKRADTDRAKAFGFESTDWRRYFDVTARFLVVPRSEVDAIVYEPWGY